MLNPFKKRSASGNTSTRTADVTGTTQAKLFDALAAKLRESSGSLGPESVAQIKSALAPFSKLGADVDSQIGQVKFEIDVAGKPGRIVMRTLVGGRAFGPMTTFTLTSTGLSTVRVIGSVTTPPASGMMGKLMNAAIERQVRSGIGETIDPLIAGAAEACKATAVFVKA
jgi:hypothetical protein